MRERVVGVAWYRREEYESIVETMTDSHTLPETFEEWQKKAEGAAAHMIARGRVVEPVYIDPITFPAWCEARGLSTDATARRLFADLRAATVEHSLH